MTEKQFESLKVGDKVMNNALTKEVPVIDINRQKGIINTGGAWRRFKNVKLAGIPVPDHFTRLEPLTHITLPVKMLKRYPLLDTVILHTILRAGPDGFVGTNETLCDATQLCRSAGTFNVIIMRLVREGLVIRENLAKKVTRFLVDEERAKDFFKA